MDIGEKKRQYEAGLQTHYKWLRLAAGVGVLFVFGTNFAFAVDYIPKEFALLLIGLGEALLVVAGTLYAYSRGTLQLLKHLEKKAKQNNARE